jgi:outer membrane immunogenic protein
MCVGVSEPEEIMKRIWLAIGLWALTGSHGPASAADLSRPAYPTKAAPSNASAYNWTGFYAGVNGGYGWGSSNWSALGSSFNTNGGLVGGQLGYNWQLGHFVYGLEGDVDWTDIHGTGNVLGCNMTACQTKSDFLSTVRGRVGVVVADRWLAYAAGGLAVGNIRATVPGFGGIDTTNAGWTVGGGVEFALAANWTAKVEYLHVDLGSANCGACGFVIGSNNVGLTEEIVRGGFNYHF